MKPTLTHILLLVAFPAFAQGQIELVPAPPLEVNPANSYSFGVGIFAYGDDEEQYPIDLDGDGTSDFTLISKRQSLSILPSGINAVLGGFADGFGGSDGMRLDAGAVVGSLASVGALWQTRIDTPSGPLGIYLCSSSNIGQSGDFAANSGFVGLQFHAGNDVHYGYLQVDCHGYGGDGGFYEGYGWNRNPGESIRVTPMPPIPLPLGPVSIVRPGYLRLQWASEIGLAFQIQSKARLDDPSWTNLNFVPVATATNTVVDLPLIGGAGFFRVVIADRIE